MDYDTISADAFGASLRGIGLNLLVRDVLAQVAFLETVFGMKARQATPDFAIISYGTQVFQLHVDGTYHANPLLGLLPETPPRGAGIEIRLYDTDPEQACDVAESASGIIHKRQQTNHTGCARHIFCAKTDMLGYRAGRWNNVADRMDGTVSGWSVGP